jgi:hypothetical protein
LLGAANKSLLRSQARTGDHRGIVLIKSDEPEKSSGLQYQMPLEVF